MYIATATIEVAINLLSKILKLLLKKTLAIKYDVITTNASTITNIPLLMYLLFISLVICNFIPPKSIYFPNFCNNIISQSYIIFNGFVVI